MAKLFYTNIDLKGNQLENGVIHNAATHPENGVAGQVYYNTDDKLMYQHNGSGWVVVGGSVEELPNDLTKVVTGSTTEKGTAKLNTTDLKNMKVGVGLQNLTGVDKNTTLSEEFQAIDTALQEVKTTYVKADGNYTSGNNNILVAGVDGNGIKTATASDYSIATELNESDNFKIPTSAAVATYIGSLAGGITYIGTIGGENATAQTLPTESVNVGDAYMVAAAGTYSPLTKASNVGDLIICNGTSPISWTEVPIDFTVENKALTNFAPKDGLQTIATVDGKDITMSLQEIRTVGNEASGFVTDISADGNNQLTITKSNALTTVSPTTAEEEGVVTSVVKNSNNTTIDVTYTSLAVDAPTNIHYVTSVSQAANGKVALQGTTFDSSITTNPSTTNAPTSNAVKDYVDGKINDLNGDATIASVNDDNIVTLQTVISETDGKIANGDSVITLAKVAKTGKAEDVDATAIKNEDNVEIVPEGTVQESLQYIARKLDKAVAGSVTSFGGETGTITVGNGLQMDGKQVSTNVTGYIVNTADTNALDINSTKVDSAYTVANTTNLATVGTVKSAIEGLVVSDITGFGADKTLATLTETDGKIAATFQDIKITHTQVSDWSSNIGVQSVTTGTANGTIGVSTNGGAAADVAVKGLQTAAYVNVDYFEKAFVDGEHDVVTIEGYTPQNDEIATQIVKFFDGDQENGALKTGANVETLYISKTVSASNPIITHDDLSGITGAMVYKGVVDGGENKLPTSNITAGWTYVVSTAGNYAGQACEPGDMIIAKETKASDVTNSDWNVINGENQVYNPGATITAGAGLQTVATVDGTDITVGVNVVGGNATIASKSGNAVTIKTGVTQSGTTGTIGNATGTDDIVLDEVAVTGAANELTVASAVYGTGDATTNAQTALTNLASAITNANITIDGHKGTITTGDGLTDVTENNKSFGIKIDSTNAKGLSVGANGLAMAIATGSTFGTVKVTSGNGLTLNDGAIAYAHNTNAITVASNNSGVVTINGTLTPDASDVMTAGNTITLKKVATTGSADDITVTSGNYGGTTSAASAQQALTNLATNMVYVKRIELIFNNNTATITIDDADLINSAITEIRDGSHNVVECDVVYNKTTITVTANNAPNDLYAIVHYKKA